MMNMNKRMELNMDTVDQVTGGVLTDEDRWSLTNIARNMKLRGFSREEAITSIGDSEDYEECVALFEAVYASN